MPIDAARFSMNVRCDAHEYTEARFTGQTQREAMSAARKAGWHIGMYAGDPPGVRCPECVQLHCCSKCGKEARYTLGVNLDAVETECASCGLAPPDFLGLPTPR